MGFPVTATLTEDTGVVGGNLVATGDADDGRMKGGFGRPNSWDDTTYTGTYGTLVVDTDGTWTYTADNSQSAIQDLNTGDTIREVIRVYTTYGSWTSIRINIEGQDEPPCFVRGTLIDTPSGPRPIETLHQGDMVLTADAGPQEIRWIGSKRLDSQSFENYEALRPIRIMKDSFGPGVPSRDLLVSPMHRLLLNSPQNTLLFGQEEVFCSAKHLLNGQTIVSDPAPKVEYFHILFDQHQVIQANDCPSESFYPGKIGLTNFDIHAQEQVFALFPELRALPETYGAAARHILRRYEAETIRDLHRPEPKFLVRLSDAA